MADFMGIIRPLSLIKILFNTRRFGDESVFVIR
jgi:hypothetical protein